MIPASVGIGIREHIQFAIAAFKAQIKCLWGPQNAHPGFASRIWFFFLPVRTESDRPGVAPLSRGMRSIELDIVTNERRHDLRGWRGTQRRLVSLLHSKKNSMLADNSNI